MQKNIFISHTLQLLFLMALTSCAVQQPASNNRVHAFRLHPGQDLKQQILTFAKEQHIQAGYIITCVGSLQKATLRLANQPNTQSWNNKFEIVSLVGTFGADCGAHVHLSISDSTGRTIGGHLTEGNLIYTTAELVVGELTDVTFTRKLDSMTTYNELFIEKK